MGKLLIAMCFGLILSIAGLFVGLSFNANIVNAVGRLAFEDLPGPALPTLQTLTRDAATDREALSAIVAYYADHEAEIGAFFAENNPTRRKALFVMYVLHISHPYGVVESPADSIIGYIRNQRTSHCGLFARWQIVISQAFGLTARWSLFEDGSHGWVEVKVDGRWEVFDSTINTWLSDSVQALQAGVTRQYRNFFLLASTSYAPYPEVILLRNRMIGLGVNWGKQLSIRVEPVRAPLLMEKLAWKSY